GDPDLGVHAALGEHLLDHEDVAGVVVDEEQVDPVVAPRRMGLRLVTDGAHRMFPKVGPATGTGNGHGVPLVPAGRGDRYAPRRGAAWAQPPESRLRERIIIAPLIRP